jgi:hypothetical protein
VPYNPQGRFQRSPSSTFSLGREKTTQILVAIYRYFGRILKFQSDTAREGLELVVPSKGTTLDPVSTPGSMPCGPRKAFAGVWRCLYPDRANRVNREYPRGGSGSDPRSTDSRNLKASFRATHISKDCHLKRREGFRLMRTSTTALRTGRSEFTEFAGSEYVPSDTSTSGPATFARNPVSRDFRVTEAKSHVQRGSR